MVKCFYLDGEYPERGYREYIALDIILAGVGGNGIIIRDRYGLISSEDIERFEMYDETDEWDSFKKYHIANTDKIRLLCENMPCKILVLVRKTEISENNIIDEIVTAATKR